MKESNEIYDRRSNESIKKVNNSKDLKEPIYEMTIESEKGRKEIINIYSNSKPEEIAYNFCKENNLDFETLELMINQIKKLMKLILDKNEEKEKNNIEKKNKLFVSGEQQSLSNEKIIKNKSFKENNFKKKNIMIDKHINLNENINNNTLTEINKNNNDINYLKIDGNFKEKQKYLKASAIITNTINNCLELIEKEEKYITSSNSPFSSKLGTSSIQNKKDSINSKENIDIFNVYKEIENKRDEINNNNIESISYTNNNRNIKVSKSFVNSIPKSINAYTSRNVGGVGDSNSKNNKRINIIEIDNNNNKNVSDEYKNSNKNNIKSLKNSNINNKLNVPNSSISNEFYCNKQKEIMKNVKNKNFQKIINIIKKNNMDINQLSSESLTKNNNILKKKKIKNINNMKNYINYKIKPNNNISFGINNKRNNLRLNTINNNCIKNSKDNIVYYDINEKDQFYSTSKNEDNSTLNNIIKNSMSINSNYFSNLNSIKNEINMTILSKQKKNINIPTPKNKNNIILINNYNKKKNRNYKTLTDANNDKKKFTSQNKLLKDFKSKIFSIKNDSKAKKLNINVNYSKSKISSLNNNKININDNYNLINNIALNSPLLIKQFFNVTNLKKYRNNFRSPQLKTNTTKYKNKNKHRDSLIKNNEILLSQSSRNNNINEYNNEIKQRCNSFNDFNSNISNIFINLKYSNNKKKTNLLGYLDNNSDFFYLENNKKTTKKRNKSSNKIYGNTNSFGNKKSMNKTIYKALTCDINLNSTKETNNNSYSYKNKKKIYSNNNFDNLKNKFRNKYSTNINKKRPCYLFIKSQNSSPPSTTRRKRKKNHSILLQNSCLRKKKLVGALKEIFNHLSNKKNKMNILKINKNNLLILEDIIKPIQKIIQNCEQKNNIISIKDFVLKGALLFDNFPFEEQISILNFN